MQTAECRLDVSEYLQSKEHSYDDFAHWAREHNKGASVETAQEYLEWRESLKSLVIDESNFSQYFHDCGKSAPRPGQVLACYETKAELRDGNFKRDLIHLLLTHHNGVTSAYNLLKKIGKATDKSAITLVRQMNSDLMLGMSTEDVAKKPYEFESIYSYYTYKECLPENDPKWWSTSLIQIKRSPLPLENESVEINTQ